MKALVLAAGYGKRLKALTLDKPKALVEVSGIPLVFFSLYNLKKINIKEIIINLHYKGDQVKALLGDGKKYGLRVSYSVESEILGTGGGIKKVESFFENEENFLVLNSDIVSNIDLSEMVSFHSKARSIATLGVKEKIKKDLFYDTQGKLYSIGKEIGQKNYGVFTGIQVLHRTFFEYAGKEFSSSIEVYRKYIEEGKNIMVFPAQNHFWYDLGTFETKLDFEEELKTCHADHIASVKREMGL